MITTYLGNMCEGADTNIRLPRSHASTLLGLPTPFFLSHVQWEHLHGNLSQLQ